MKTHNGNIGKVCCDIGKITFDSLEKFNIPFDEIYFGKPYADVYIDDLALNCYDNIEKALGFYMNTVSPRDFNSISAKSIEIYVKKSEKGLDGEIYFYNNIPKQLKDLFPILLDYDKDNGKWYNVEKINGLTVSSLYLSELLTTDMLKHIMNSIQRIHKQEKESGDYKHINIYENYSNKLKIRHESYDYSKFLVDNKLFNEIYKGLQNYENDKKGKPAIIHGDTVMTNILINNFGKIKFIDMRGKIGNELSIYGDAMYDWAKLYQSLIGYDKILQNKNISSEYQKSMTNTFEKHFIKLNPDMNLEDLKLITKSLLFSLVPLHDNLKCIHYLNLLQNI
jgi:aminoglycoside phosphotransferase